MMYMHYCKQCDHIFMLNGHRLICPKCVAPLTELRISYMDYTDMDIEARETFRADCADEQKLKKMKTTYRMYKYSKWYKELQAQNPDNLPITTLLANLMISKDAEDKARKKRRQSQPEIAS